MEYIDDSLSKLIISTDVVKSNQYPILVINSLPDPIIEPKSIDSTNFYDPLTNDEFDTFDIWDEFENQSSPAIADSWGVSSSQEVAQLLDAEFISLFDFPSQTSVDKEKDSEIVDFISDFAMKYIKSLSSLRTYSFRSNFLSTEQLKHKQIYLILMRFIAQFKISREL